MSEQQVNLKLVGEVEKRPALYNFSLPDYSKKDEKDKAWNEVAKAVNMTENECKERWKNLRAVFVRNMKPLKSGAGAKAKRAYYLLEAMQFTVPYIKALGNLPNLTQPKEEEDEYYEEMDHESNATGQDSLSETPSPSQQQTFSPSATPLYTITEISQRRENITKKQSEPSTIPKKKTTMKKDAVDEAFIDFVQTKKAKMLSSSDHSNKYPNRTEALKMFLLSLLPDLVKMTDEEVRQFKRKALDAVDDILSTHSMIPPQVIYSSRSSTPSPHSEL